LLSSRGSTDSDSSYSEPVDDGLRRRMWKLYGV
jgi:hypothetical protein